MKKTENKKITIGILTFHRCVNNGAVMQAYSLSKRLKQEFYGQNVHVEIIDYQMPRVDSYCAPSIMSYYRNCNPVLALKRTYRLLRNPCKFKQDKKRIAVFEKSFVKLPLSKKKIYEDSTDQLYEYMNNNYDIIIAGSDAIWNYDVRGLPNPYFLSDQVKCQKFSYAASVYGMNYENIQQSDKENIRRILDSYRLLGTRDDESEKFVHAIGSTNRVIHTCDPTVFLDVNRLPISEEDLKDKLKKRGFDFTKPTIGMMGTDAMCDMLRKMFGIQYQIVALFNYCEKADCNLYDFSPFEWAYVFRLFKVTVTTFFHGTLLSLRNGTPVVCIALDNDYSKRHKTKVQDVLERVGLQGSYFKSDYRTQSIQEIQDCIVYYMSRDVRNEIIDRMDREAKSFLPFFYELNNTVHELMEKMCQ
ncbi:MAG: polysaccharide pyruvyl transferase family protein [Eubacteriales bacterium]|nr:polysaccharide pyruvyl transferase family protein [Eubacteriales bacterium]